MTFWKNFIAHPQTVWLRKAIFQFHMWSGIGIGLYVLLVSVTGSIAVYRNELYEAATPAPHAGADVATAVPRGIRMVSGLLNLHDELFLGDTGRRINAIGGLMLVVLALTGIVVWWPGIQAWRRSLSVRRNVGWRRFTWDLHSMVGFWTLAFIVIFGVSGAYLGNPQTFQGIVDWAFPPPAVYAGERLIDKVMYWLAFLHFGRINGIGIPCKGPGLCDQVTKLVWAVVGLSPTILFATGTVMWWNRAVRKKLKK